MVRSRFAAWLLTALVAASLVSTQVIYDRSTTTFQAVTEETIREQDAPLLPNYATLRLLSFGNEHVLADFIWLQTIQYFGAGLSNHYPALGPLTETVTDLDPKFAYPYEFGLIVLPLMTQKSAAERLGLKAQQYIPNNGLLTYYLASLYHIDIKDYKKAAHYYELASKEPGAPGAAKTLAGIALNQVSDSITDRLVAITYWETVYENAQNSDDKDRAKKWWAQMQIVYSIELAAQQYQKAHGSYPADIQTLVTSGYLANTPVSPLGRKFILDPGSGRVDFSQMAT